MKLRWMIALAGVMLSSAALAKVTVTFEGVYTSLSTQDACAPAELNCVGRTTALETPVTFLQTFSFEYGVAGPTAVLRLDLAVHGRVGAPVRLDHRLAALRQLPESGLIGQPGAGAARQRR